MEAAILLSHLLGNIKNVSEYLLKTLWEQVIRYFHAFYFKIVDFKIHCLDWNQKFLIASRFVSTFHKISKTYKKQIIKSSSLCIEILKMFSWNFFFFFINAIPLFLNIVHQMFFRYVNIIQFSCRSKLNTDAM